VHDLCDAVPLVIAEEALHLRKDTLTTMGLVFLCFELMKEILLLRFMEAYENLPQALTDLGLWRSSKMKCPVSFRGIYQFWVNKP